MLHFAAINSFQFCASKRVHRINYFIASMSSIEYRELSFETIGVSPIMKEQQPTSNDELPILAISDYP